MKQSVKTLKDVLSFGNDVKKRQQDLVRLVVFIDEACDPALVARAKQELMPQQGNVLLHVEQFDKSLVPGFHGATDFTCIFAGDSPYACDLADMMKDAELPFCLINFKPSENFQKRVQSLALSHDFVSATSLDELFLRLAKHMLDKLGDKDLACGANFPFIRKALALSIVQETAKQNALVGAVALLPGADMPVMTLNQIKMVLQIASAYGQELSLSSLKELSAVLGSAFVMRTLARQLVGLVPFGGFALKASIAYSGTQLIGKTMIKYCEEGRDLSSLCKSFMRMHD